MDEPSESQALTLVLGNASKLRWGISLLLKGAVAVISCISGILPAPPGTLAVLALALIFVAEFVQWRADRFKARAEAVKRKMEYEDGFGWAMRRADIADERADMSAAMVSKLETPQKPYFSSSRAPGVARALENLRESSWWSKHLATTMLQISGWLAAVCVAGSMAVLMGASLGAPDQILRRAVMAVLALTVSAGLWKVCAGYSAFRKQCERTESNAVILLQHLPDEHVALLAIWEYQIARSSAPTVPTGLWESRQKELNKLWKQYLAEQGVRGGDAMPGSLAKEGK